MEKSLWKLHKLLLKTQSVYLSKYTLVIMIQKSHQRLKNKHRASDYSLLTHCQFDVIKNKHDYWRGKDCMKTFCKDLKKECDRNNKRWQKNMIPFTIKQNRSYQEQKVCYIRKKEFSVDNKNKKYQKVRDHCHYTGK